MSSTSEIVTREETRLRKAGIRWEHIHVTDGVPVIIVDERTMKGLIAEREQGQIFRGRFVSHSSDATDWTASYVDESDVHHHRDGLTERLAYRFVLGYKVGRSPQVRRYVGGREYRHRVDRKMCRRMGCRPLVLLRF